MIRMDTDNYIPRTYKCIVRLEHRIFWPAFLIMAAVIGISVYFGIDWYWVVIMCLPFLLVGIAVQWFPVIEPANGIVRERALFLFGPKVLAERITPLNDFTEIFYIWTPGDSSQSDYRLGPRHKTGRKLWIDGCWTIPRSVEETAWQISCDTGIRLRGDTISK